jgi:hypothetical protein
MQRTHLCRHLPRKEVQIVPHLFLLLRWKDIFYLKYEKKRLCRFISYKIMAMQIIAISEMTKQMQGSMILVNKDELKLSARRQSQMIQNELVKWFKNENFCHL